jgi:anti-sigma regulatory factor (Ser/Thr protein kinase)
MTGSSGNGGPLPELELEVPSKPRFVRTARHAVGALARLHDVPEDLIEDIKLAVSEACNTAVAAEEAASAEGEILVSVWAEGDRVLIDVVDPHGKVQREVSGDPATIDTADLPFERLLALPIIRGLVDEVSISAAEEGGGLRIRMSVASPREEGRTPAPVS